MADPKVKTADEKVLSAVSWGSKKQICGEQMLEWYAGLQKAEGGQPQPPPTIQPPPTKQPKPKKLPPLVP